MYGFEWAKQAKKDSGNVALVRHFRDKVKEILNTVRRNPFEPSQGFEKLKSRKDTYSRQINGKHRVVYKILPNKNALKDPKTGELYIGIARVVSMWTHYEAGRKL
jgi:Txe/YoeB family toxin of toxin-antitoxin system